MQKRKLEELQDIRPTAQSRRMATRNQMEVYVKGWSWEKHDEVIQKETIERYQKILQVRTVGEYLSVGVFSPKDLRNGEHMPLMEVFLDPAKKDYLTKVYEREAGKDHRYRWSDGMCTNVLPDRGWVPNHYQRNVWDYIPKEDRKLLEDAGIIQPKEKRVFIAIAKWQQGIVDDKRLTKQRIECERWDRELAGIQKEPEAFRPWAFHQGNPNHWIFYEPNGGGQRIGYCTTCEKEIQAEEPLRHLQKVGCPSCGHTCTVIASGRQYAVHDTPYEVMLVQLLRGGGLVIRKYSAQRNYKRNNLTGRVQYRKSSDCIQETDRCVWKPDGTHGVYTWGLYKQRKTRWIKTDVAYAFLSGYCSYETYGLDKRTIAKIKKRMQRHCAPYLMDSMGLARCITNGTPLVEKLCKAGMINLAKDCLRTGGILASSRYTLSQKDGELHKMLNLDRARMARLRIMDGNIYTLEWLQEEKKRDTIWPDEMIRFYADNNLTVDNWRLKQILECMSLIRAWRYLSKQMELGGRSLNSTIDEWMDYMSMAKKLKMDITKEQIYKPKDLMVAHNWCIMLLSGAEIRKEAAGIRKRFPRAEKNLKDIQKYAYTGEVYSIVAPKKIDDIVAEGIALNHCVHRSDIYFDRISQKETFLMFLRKTSAPTMPWYTLEIEPGGNIRQKRTTGDKQGKDLQDALPFLQEWQSRIQKMMTAEEKKLAEASDRKRKAGYKQIRKEQKKIWHGPLAGQLLADVLEADFLGVAAQ